MGIILTPSDAPLRNALALALERINALEHKTQELTTKLYLLTLANPLKTTEIRGTLFDSLEKQGGVYLETNFNPIQLEQLRSTQRDAPLVELRRKVITSLYSQGINKNAISRLLNKCYKTIDYNLAMSCPLRKAKTKQFVLRRGALDKKIAKRRQVVIV
jgi:hypothetical protein